MTITRIGPSTTPSSVRSPSTNSKPSSPGFSIGRTSAARSSRRPSTSAAIKYHSSDTESTSSGDEMDDIGLRSDGQGDDEGYFGRLTRQNAKKRRFGVTEDGSGDPGSRSSLSGGTLSLSRTEENKDARPPTPPVDYLALATAERRRSSFAPASISPSFDSLRRRESGTGVLSSQGKVGFVGKGLSVTDIAVKPSLIAQVDGLSSSSSRSASRDDPTRNLNSVGSGGFDLSSVRRDPTDIGTQRAIDAGIIAHGDTSGRGKQAFAAYGRGHAKSQSSLGVTERPEIRSAQSGYFSSISLQPEQHSEADLQSTPIANTHTLSAPVGDEPTASSTQETRTVTNSPIAVTSNPFTSPMHIPPFLARTSPGATEKDIPPPCNPRKHRSGILLSRVRAQTGGNPLAEGEDAWMGLTTEGSDSGTVSGERSSGRRGSQALGLDIEGDQGDDRREHEDFRGVDCSASMDNAARFYHRHPYAKSAATSPVKSFGSLMSSADRSRPPPHMRRSHSGDLAEPGQSSSGSSATSGFATVGSLLARRNFSLPFPTDGHGADHARPDHGSHSLLPVRAGSAAAAAHLVPDVNANGRLVILTPTTQEWRELGLDSLKHLGGEGVGSDSGSERGKDWDRRASAVSSSIGSFENLKDAHPDSRRASAISDGVGSGKNSRRASGAGLLDERRQSQDDASNGRNRVRSDTVHSVDNLVPDDSIADTSSSTIVPPSAKDLMITIPPPSAGMTSLMGANDTDHSGTGPPSRRLSLSLHSAPPLLEETDIFAKLLSEQMAQRQRQSSSSSASAGPSQRLSPVATTVNIAEQGRQDDNGQEKPKPQLPSPRLSSMQENAGSAFSLSRSQSMREPPTAPPHMTKREKERERLFRMVGEEIERSGFSESQSARGIKQIGKGLGLDMPSGIGGMTNPIIRTESGPAVMEHAQAQRQESTTPGGISDNDKNHLIAPTPHRLKDGLHLGHSPLISEVRIDELTSPVSQERSTLDSSAASKPRSRAHSRAPSLAQLTATSGMGPAANLSAPAPLSPLTSRRRQSQRLSLLAGRTPLPHQFPAVLPPSAPTGNGPRKPSAGLSAFSAFATMTPASSAARRPPLSKDSLGSGSVSAIPGHLKQIGRSDSTISLAPSTSAPSECGTPVGETAGGLGGGGIDDYVIQSEAGKGAYGLVRRARRKGPDGLPVGDEVIIKYIIKSRILADCWKKHKVLGPIPIEIHVMEQLRNVTYRKPKAPHPWDPLRAGHPPYLDGSVPEALETGQNTPTNGDGPSRMSYKSMSRDGQLEAAGNMTSGPPELQDLSAWQAKLSYDNLKDRGHPNIVKMLDFFEDREFYYLVMPRFGIGLDLFDRIESAPDGLEPFDIRSLLGQLSDALAFLHTNGIVHRDIKDENVILDGQGHCQLIDFGSAAHWRPGRKWDTFSGTLDYASPEILRGEMYSGKEQDVWALGVVAFVMICGETPFLSAEEATVGLSDGTKARNDLMARCGGDRGNEGAEADGGGRMADALDFAERCLELGVDDRPPAEALMEHRFLLGEGGWRGSRGWLQAHTA